MTMIFKPLLLPTLFCAASLTGAWNRPATVAAPATHPVVTAAALPALKSARPLIEDDERAQLQAAEQAASQLGAMRGGEFTNHELTIGVIVLAILVVLILI